MGSQHSIGWVSNATSGIVSIELSRNGGNIWEFLYNNIIDDGTENWIVIGPDINNAKIRISDITGNPSDVSDSVFSIIPQNLAPILSWTGESGYENDGVESRFREHIFDIYFQSYVYRPRGRCST